MHLESPLKDIYSSERMSAIEAQRLAHEIAFAPIVFQVSRLMLRFGILEALSQAQGGMELMELSQRAKLSRYATQVLLEASLTIGTVLLKDERFYLSKAGWFLLNDPMVRVNLDFNHDVNYQGLFELEAALTEECPAGLKVFGDWPSIYEGLSQLPKQVQDSWFAFDHFYSDNSFDAALEIVFNKPVKKLLDVGGNTGRWACRCVAYDKLVELSIMDLPQQLELMRQQVAGKEGADRIHAHPANLLDPNTKFPKGFDAIWMSQFLDCFAEEEVLSILQRAAASMNSDTSLYIMETFWDRQRHETAAYCLTQISLYFTALANGNSKMYHSDDMLRLVDAAGLRVEHCHHGVGLGHSILHCKLK